MTAREMFEALGYHQVVFSPKYCSYSLDDGGYIKSIEFIGIKKEIRLHDLETYNDNKSQDVFVLDEYELKAINKQMEELGWIQVITKQEYIEALERMKESYYNLDGCMSAMNKFKEDINLLAGLVNEHFEEKQETNFEHYKDGILDCCIDNLAVVKGIPKSCSKIDCNDCDFKINQKECCEIAKDWLKQPYKKLTYKLNKFEFDLIQTYRDCHESCKFSEFKQLIELKNKGYFKDIALDLKIHEVLDNYEVTK